MKPSQPSGAPNVELTTNGAAQPGNRYPRLKDLAHTRLKTTARVVFAALCDYANPKCEMWPSGAPRVEGFAAWPSVQTIMGVTGLSDRGVQIALRELETAGAIQCIRRSRGGGSRKAGYWAKANTNCYLLTPNAVPREIAANPITPNVIHPALPVETAVTPNDGCPDPELPSREPRTVFTPDPECYSPEETNHHHQKEETKKGSNSNDLLRTETEDPTARLRRRFRERFGSGADALLAIVLTGLNNRESEIQEFVDFDEGHTGAPHHLTNPGGYYRKLVMNFQLAQSVRREAARQQRLRELERQMAGQGRAEKTSVCSLGICNGRGEVYDSLGSVVEVCACEEGRKLPQTVRELIEQLKKGAA